MIEPQPKLQATQAGEPQPRLQHPLLRWFALRPGLTLTLLVLVVLGPFLAKPFNVDDPLFLWCARQIQAHPTNPYGIDVNWYGYPAPMWEVTKNPPLACYYLALAASLLGWSEIALHAAFLLPALAVVYGTWRLARHFCERPMFATCACLFTPVFLISSTSLMCDTFMLALWVWAMVLWCEGLTGQVYWKLALSAVLMTLAAYAKYFGLCLIPLLAVYSLMERRRFGRWAVCFLIPAAGLVAYQWATSSLYGHGLLSDAGDYATHAKLFQIPYVARGLTALAFTGAGMAMATLMTPWILRRNTAAVLSVIAVAFTVGVFAEGSLWQKYNALSGISHGWLEAQMILWVFGGISILALAVDDVRQHRDAKAWLLALWIGGTFLFAAFLNWTVNGRSMLPMAPAVGILLARRLAASDWQNDRIRRTGVWTGFALGVTFTMVSAQADFAWAKTVRESAQATYEKFGRGTATLRFEGHWGWQYYLEQLGAKAITMNQPPPPAGDLLAIPGNNTNLRKPNPQLAHLLEVLTIGKPQFASTFSPDVGAGFYSSIWGPLPFAFGRVSPEQIEVYEVGPPVAKPSQ